MINVTDADWIVEEFGRGLEFAGGNERIDTRDIDLDFCTITAWVRGDVDSDQSYLLNKNFNGTNVPYNLSYRGSNLLTTAGMAFYDGVWRKTGVNTQIAGDGLTHFIAGTYDGVTLRYYVDGIEDATLDYSSILPKNDNVVTLGRYINDARSLDGAFFEIRLYDYAMPATMLKWMNDNPYADLIPKTRVLGKAAAAAGISMPLVMLQHNHLAGGIRANA